MTSETRRLNGLLDAIAEAAVVAHVQSEQDLAWRDEALKEMAAARDEIRSMIARLTRELEEARERERARGDDLTAAIGHLSALVDMLHHDGYIERCGDHAVSLVSAAERYLESPSREQEVGAATPQEASGAD